MVGQGWVLFLGLVRALVETLCRVTSLHNVSSEHGQLGPFYPCTCSAFAFLVLLPPQSFKCTPPGGPDSRRQSLGKKKHQQPALTDSHKFSEDPKGLSYWVAWNLLQVIEFCLEPVKSCCFILCKYQKHVNFNSDLLVGKLILVALCFLSQC